MVKQEVISLYKNRGETPLECLERFRKENPDYKDEKMTYAGRLDPLAEGLLLVLVGEECKNKEKYLEFDKEYELEILFGFSTDTYDVLGKVTKAESTFVIPEKSGIQNLDFRLHGNDTTKELISSFVGKFSQKYPSFSSKTVKGIALFNHAKNGTLSEEEIPSKDVEVKNIEITDERIISKNDLENFVKESIAIVSGDFRQEEIFKNWKEVFGKIEQEEFKIISIKVLCTSGTYMRSLANSIGEKIGVPALALNIKRISVGKYNI